jgi:hypothetical protein
MARHGFGDPTAHHGRSPDRPSRPNSRTHFLLGWMVGPGPTMV